jgi:hypothetical protein
MVLDPEEYTPPYIWRSLSTDPNNFVERDDVLNRLNNLLAEHLAVVVVGMKGTGKTELAFQYSKKYESNYGGKCHWFDLCDRNLADVLANHKNVTEELLKKEGKKLTSEEIELSKLKDSELIQLCWNLILDNKNSHHRRMLVVLDNVSCKITEGMFPPKELNTKLLVMAKESNLIVHSEINKEEDLKKLELKDAVIFLGKCASRQIKDKAEYKAAEYICDELLDCSLLGIELAGHYLRKNHNITITQFKEKLENQYKESGAPSERSWIDSLLELSWQELDPQSQKLAKLLGLFAPRIIPFEFPTKIATYAELKIRLEKIDECTHEKIDECTQFKRQLKSLFASEEKRLKPKEVFQALANLRLIKWDSTNNTAMLDTTIRDFLKAKADKSEDIENQRIFVKIILEKGLKLKTVNPERFVLIAPHLDEVISKYTPELTDEQFELFVGIGNYYDDRRMYIAGSEWYKRWLEKANKRSEGKNCSKEGKWKNLATLYEKIDCEPKNRPRYKRACQICEELSKEAPNPLADLNALIEIVKIFEEKLLKSKPTDSLCHLYKRIWDLSKAKFTDADQRTKDAKTKYQCKCPDPDPAPWTVFTLH